MVGTQEKGEQQGYAKGLWETIGQLVAGVVAYLLPVSGGMEIPKTVYLLKKNRNLALVM